jgi:hypothetical protein
MWFLGMGEGPKTPIPNPQSKKMIRIKYNIISSNKINKIIDKSIFNIVIIIIQKGTAISF